MPGISSSESKWIFRTSLFDPVWLRVRSRLACPSLSGDLRDRSKSVSPTADWSMKRGEMFARCRARTSLQLSEIIASRSSWEINKQNDDWAATMVLFHAFREFPFRIVFIYMLFRICVWFVSYQLTRFTLHDKKCVRYFLRSAAIAVLITLGQKPGRLYISCAFQWRLLNRQKMLLLRP